MKPLPLIILLIASLISILLAQDCNNPLLNIYGLQSLDSPQSGADLPYCEGLQAADTCCSADVVAGFQGRLNGLIDKLNNYDAARDLYIAQLRKDVFDRYQDLLENVNDNLDANLGTIRTINSGLADQLQSDINILSQVNDEANDINSQFVAAMDDFQAARNNCFTAALQVQASSWCLACDPNYATQGVSPDGTVTFSDDLCESISEACHPYFEQGARFNPLIRVRQAYWRLGAIERYLNNVSSTGQVGDFSVPPDPYNPLSTQQDVTVPEQWIAGAEETSMTERCQALWAGDELLNELLTVGNASPAEIVEEQMLIAEEESSVDSEPQVIIVDATGTRLLQNALAGPQGVWLPTLATTGLDFSDLLGDPGDFFNASDYSDYWNEIENLNNVTDLTDNNNDLTDNDLN